MPENQASSMFIKVGNFHVEVSYLIDTKDLSVPIFILKEIVVVIEQKVEPSSNKGSSGIGSLESNNQYQINSMGSIA
jgi:hypothetical protein